MGKRIICLCLCLVLWGSLAAAELDFQAWESIDGTYVYLDDNRVDTVIRFDGQPFQGSCDGDAGVCAFLDFVEYADLDRVLVRLSLSVETGEELMADSLSITVEKTTYTFPVSAQVSEYDLVFQEDYSLCLTDESLPMLKAMAKGKKGSFAFTLSGAESLSGTLEIPAADAATVYNQYTALGGHKQRLDDLHDRWPVEISKAK